MFRPRRQDRSCSPQRRCFLAALRQAGALQDLAIRLLGSLLSRFRGSSRRLTAEALNSFFGIPASQVGSSNCRPRSARYCVRFTTNSWQLCRDCFGSMRSRLHRHCDVRSGQKHLGSETIQWCWAHLLRDFVALSDTDTSINNIGQELVDLTDEYFTIGIYFEAAR